MALPNPPKPPHLETGAPAAAPPPALSQDQLPAAAAPGPLAGLTSASAMPLTQMTGEDMLPMELRQQLGELERWAISNRGEARHDSIAFWSLKVPAILASAGAGIIAHFGWTTASLVIGVIASACVIIDGIHPRGMLRNTHLRAFHDTRILTSRMMSQWRSRNAAADGINIARRIIRDAENERERIAAYVRDAETALNSKNEA